MIAQTGSTGSVHDQLVVALNEMLVRIYEIFESSSQFLTDTLKEELFELGGELGIAYMRLYTEAYRAGRKLWKMTPKIHLTQELLQYQCQILGNPSYFWCYADEDLVGAMIEVASSCHVLTLGFTCLTKWMVTAFEHDSEDEY